MGQGELVGLPVAVVGHIEEIIGGPVRLLAVLPAVEHAQLTAEIFKFRVPGLHPVEGHVRVAAHFVIHHLRLLRQVENRVGLAEGDEVFHKFIDVAVGLQLVPVEPGGLVVLAVGVVVAPLGVAELVPRQQKGRPLAQEHQHQGVADLFFPHLHDLLLAGGTLHPAVPAVVAVGAVPAVLPVGLVVLPVVGDHVHQGEAVGGGHVVDGGAGLGVPADAVHQGIDLPLIPL